MRLSLFLSLIFSRSRGPASAHLEEKCKCENILNGAPYFVQFKSGTRMIFTVFFACEAVRGDRFEYVHEQKQIMCLGKDSCVHICGGVYNRWEFLNFELLVAGIISNSFSVFNTIL